MILPRRFSSKRPIVLILALVLVGFWWLGIPGWGSRRGSIHGIPYKTSSYDWASQKQQYPITDIRTMPSGLPLQLPKVQHDFSSSAAKDGSDSSKAEVESRRNAVLHAFKRSWAGYREHAWAWDELMPVSGQGKNTFGGYSATLVDSLDTLWLMGMKEEFDEAVRVVALIDWDHTSLSSINVFETTIRHLGGLLAAYDLSGEPVLLLKAIELADMLYFSFDTETRMPPFWFSFKSAKRGTQVPGDHDPSASGCSLSMEFTRLSQITGDPKYYDAAERVKEFLHQTQHGTKIPGIWPVFLDYRRLRATESTFSIGGQADSLYEYLPKMHALLGGLDPQYAEMAVESLDTITKNLLFRPMIPDDADILFSGNAHLTKGAVELIPEMQHLTCFAGGMYGLASRLFSRDDYLSIAARLTRGCVWAYAAFPLGVMPEISGHVACSETTTPAGADHLAPCDWDADKFERSTSHGRAESSAGLPGGFRSVDAPHYILRPEAIESVFYMWRLTGEQEWRDAAWDMFQAIVAATETPIAYSAIRSVEVARSGKPIKSDSMESFWFSETLKYFFLIFSDEDLLSLDDWVLNTEAHPFKRPASGAGRGPQAGA